GKRLAIVSGHSDEFAKRLVDPEFVRFTGGNDVTWTIATTITCPPLNQPKHTRWPQIRDELFAADWNLLLCSAGSLSAITCERARQEGRMGLDTGALDAVTLTKVESSSDRRQFQTPP
ncbi:MAG: hypothetical protein KDA89_02545, partial [Planctomycetaceae bacterium]|nr:hypothetical protein [Planctomycetaceae bacterium]